MNNQDIDTLITQVWTELDSVQHIEPFYSNLYALAHHALAERAKDDWWPFTYHDEKNSFYLVYDDACYHEKHKQTSWHEWDPTDPDSLAVAMLRAVLDSIKL